MADHETAQVWRMRLELGPTARREPRWPNDVAARTFTLADARPLHSLLLHGYRNGGGNVAAFDPWLRRMTTHPEFDSQLWFLAESRGTLAGAALCWTSAFVKDLVVHESWRHRGLGEALVRHAMSIFAKRGAPAIELKVDATNTNAIALYERLGMRVVERIELI